MRRLTDLYPSQSVSDSAMPYGRFVNSQFEGDPAGTPLEANWANEMWGAYQAILTEANVTPNGVAETRNASQLLDSLMIIANRRANFAITGQHNGQFTQHIPTQAPGGQSIWNTNSSGMLQLVESSFAIILHVSPPFQGWRPTGLRTYVARHDHTAPTKLQIALKRGTAFATSDTPETLASIEYFTPNNFRSALGPSPGTAVAEGDRIYVEVRGQVGGTFDQPIVRAIRVIWSPDI